MVERRDVCRVLMGKPEERDHFGDPGVDGRILKMDFSGSGVCGGMDLFDLAQDRDRWRSYVNAVMNLEVP
jgi:hypothetical protein